MYAADLARRLLLGALLVTALAASAAAQGNYFGPRKDASAPAKQDAPATPAPAAPSTYCGPRKHARAAPATPATEATKPAPEPSAFRMPYWVRSILTQVAEYQRRINAALTGEVRRLRTG